MSATKVRIKSAGRRAGGSNHGYFYRSGRGWTVTGTSHVLTDSDGARLTDRNTPEAVLRESYIVYRTELANDAAAESAATEDKNAVPLIDVISKFLTYSREHDALATYDLRRRFLFDFVCGLPAEFKDTDTAELLELERAGKLRRIHRGYGGRLVSQLTKLDVLEWVRVHTGWKKGGKKAAVQAIKRALNWAVEFGLIASNPVKGLPAGKSNVRVTYFTPEVERAMLDNSKKDFALALRVLIATGARYNCEFAKLERKHVENFAEGRQKWIWQNGSKVRGKRRVIAVKLPWLIALVNELCQKYPTGPIFRTMTGIPWTKGNMKNTFERLRRKLKKQGFDLTGDSLYSCRHTYAKRQLENGLSIEKLAARMGNTRQVAWEHYGQWCERNEEAIWND